MSKQNGRSTKSKQSCRTKHDKAAAMQRTHAPTRRYDGERLRDYTLITTTRSRYLAAVQQWLTWSQLDAIDIDAGVHSPSSLDCCMERWFHYMWRSGESGGKGRGNKALWGLLFLYPQWKHSFPLSRQALKGWDNAQKSISYPPMPWHLCVAMSATMARSGHLEMGVATLLSFDCYLRVSEMLHLRVCDVALPDDRRRGTDQTAAGIRLAHTKTRDNLWVSIRLPDLCSLLRHLLRERHGSDRVFTFTASSYRAAFRSALSALGAGTDGFVPHSNRHGGATHDHMNGMSIEDIMHRGRWKSNDSARLYIQAGQAMLLTQSVPAESIAIGRRVVKQLAINMLRCAEEYQGEGATKGKGA